jgi:hypothetical protein
MLKENSPLLTDEFLDELANEINQQYGFPIKDEIAKPQQEQ